MERDWDRYLGLNLISFLVWNETDIDQVSVRSVLVKNENFFVFLNFVKTERYIVEAISMMHTVSLHIMGLNVHLCTNTRPVKSLQETAKDIFWAKKWLLCIAWRCGSVFISTFLLYFEKKWRALSFWCRIVLLKTC